MSMNLDLSLRTLFLVTEAMPRQRTFLFDTFFGNRENLDTETVTIEFKNFKREEDYIDFEIFKYPKNHPEQQQKVSGYMEFYKYQTNEYDGVLSFECEDKYIFFIFLSIIQKLGLV